MTWDQIGVRAKIGAWSIDDETIAYLRLSRPTGVGV